MVSVDSDPAGIRTMVADEVSAGQSRSSPSYAIGERSLAFRRRGCPAWSGTRSYVSKVGRGSVVASRSFAESADQICEPGRRSCGGGRRCAMRWRGLARSGSGMRRLPVMAPSGRLNQSLSSIMSFAELAYRDGVYRAVIRRLIRNTGAQRPLR
jgi:hypothetical protein